MLLVVARYATKWMPAGFASLSEARLNAWHLAIGPAILLLMLLRLAWALLGVIALHVSGARDHALVKQDGVVRRMVPGQG